MSDTQFEDSCEFRKMLEIELFVQKALADGVCDLSTDSAETCQELVLQHLRMQLQKACLEYSMSEIEVRRQVGVAAYHMNFAKKQSFNVKMASLQESRNAEDDE